MVKWGMEPLHFDHQGPAAFTLATDNHFTPYDPENDQVWELVLSHRGSQFLYLQTTYRLRARQMRLFPVIALGNQRFAGIASFSEPPIISAYHPDSIQIRCMPILGTDVIWDCFVPDGDSLVGGLEVRNTGADLLTLSAGLAAVLAPMQPGAPIHPEREGINRILTGQSGTLHPVLFMTGGPIAVNSPYPALSLHMHLAPGQSRRLSWALVTKGSQSESLDAARKLTATPWRETSTRHAMCHAAHTVHIRTGEPGWDAAFELAQKQAAAHWGGEDTGYLRVRLPDQARAPSPDRGRLNDLTLLEALHLSHVILPSQASQVARILRTFLSRVDSQGCLPSNLNQGNFGKPLRECPLLATLCWELGLYQQEPAFLAEIFPRLCQTLDAWFPSDNGQGSRSVPTLESPQQLHMDTGLFLFDPWDETGRGLDIRTVQSPALLAMLHREATALSRIARQLGESSAQAHYAHLANRLQGQIESAWDERQSAYRYLDRDSNRSPARELHFPGKIRPRLQIHKTFLEPQRLHLHLVAADEDTRACQVTLTGSDPQGAPLEETFRSSAFRWVMHQAHLTSQNLYQSIQSISMKGFHPEDRFILETADLTQTDLTCLLPVWSGAASDDQIRALLETHLNPDKPSQSYGIPETWQTRHPLPEGLTLRVNVLWNTLILQGLTQAGYTKEACALFTNLMNAIVQGLRDFSGFYPTYGVMDGKPAGARNALTGLAPVGLFLQLAGIQIFSPNRIAVWGESPFLWPIEVRWQGLSLRREGLQIDVTFPDGSVHRGTSEQPLTLTAQSQEKHA